MSTALHEIPAETPAPLLENRLSGRILIVENDPMIALSLADDLTELGYAVIGPATRLGDALRLAASEKLDGAIVDLSEFGNAVAAVLRDRGIPFHFVSGCSEAPAGPYAAVPLLRKPFSFAQLRSTLNSLLLRA